MRPISAKQDQAPDRNASAPRILVVDDNADAATSLGRLLKLSGYDVKVAHDGHTALAEVARFRPQVVLLDLGMPGMDGLETASRIQQLAAGKELSLIAVTGWGQDEDRQRTEAAGFIAHFVKPIKITQLEAVLSRLTASDSLPAGKSQRPSPA
jgi:CheY-like chemotaxis protein